MYNFLGIDEKTKRNLLTCTFDHDVRIVYSNIRALYSNKIHVTIHPGEEDKHIKNSYQDSAKKCDFFTIRLRLHLCNENPD